VVAQIRHFTLYLKHINAQAFYTIHGVENFQVFLDFTASAKNAI